MPSNSAVLEPGLADNTPPVYVRGDEDARRLRRESLHRLRGVSFIPAIDSPRLRGLARQVIVFGGVGVTATLVHLFVALSIRRYWRLDPLGANMIALLCAVLVSYAGHALLTFRVQLARRKQFVRFVVISIGGLGLS